MASAEHGHGHADDGAVHAHVSSPFFYAAIFAALLMLTAATVGQSYVDLGSLNIILVVIIGVVLSIVRRRGGGGGGGDK